MIPCKCGSQKSFWHGDPYGLRTYCCDSCWAQLTMKTRTVKELEDILASYQNQIIELIQTILERNPPTHTEDERLHLTSLQERAQETLKELHEAQLRLLPMATIDLARWVCRANKVYRANELHLMSPGERIDHALNETQESLNPTQLERVMAECMLDGWDDDIELQLEEHDNK